MFLKQMILQQKEKYRYAYKFNGDRMARQKIMMPVDDNSRIDYRAIKNYMKAKELEKFIEYSLKTIKFEQESKKKEYEDMFSEISEIRKKIAKLFFDVLELYSRYSISEIEQETLNKFQLYHDLKI